MTLASKIFMGIAAFFALVTLVSITVWIFTGFAMLPPTRAFASFVIAFIFVMIAVIGEIGAP